VSHVPVILAAAAGGVKEDRQLWTLRINETPVIDVYLVHSTEAPGGIGEPGTSAAAPAVCNAIFAATGKRVRKLPVDTAQLRSA
jgi:isoquinoline 1-oxidoreductase subunit beta